VKGPSLSIIPIGIIVRDVIKKKQMMTNATIWRIVDHWLLAFPIIRFEGGGERDSTAGSM
jgi:hypothetical protein